MPASWLRKPFISSAESTEGMRFGSLGVGTRRAGLSLNFPSRTQYLKKERSAASLRAMELFSSPWSCKRSEEHTSELQSRGHLVCRLLLEKKKNIPPRRTSNTIRPP